MPMHHIRHAVIAMAISLSPAAWSCGQEIHPENPELKALTDRVDRLEKTVVKDAFHPDDTVLARLQAIEDRLDARDKAGNVANKADARGDEQLRRSLDAISGQMRDLDQRLRRAESADHKEEPRSEAELREIRSSLSQISRSLSDLPERVRRLEAKG